MLGVPVGELAVLAAAIAGGAVLTGILEIMFGLFRAAMAVRFIASPA